MHCGGCATSPHPQQLVRAGQALGLGRVAHGRIRSCARTRRHRPRTAWATRLPVQPGPESLSSRRGPVCRMSPTSAAHAAASDSAATQQLQSPPAGVQRPPPTEHALPLAASDGPPRAKAAPMRSQRLPSRPAQAAKRQVRGHSARAPAAHGTAAGQSPPRQRCPAGARRPAPSAPHLGPPPPPPHPSAGPAPPALGVSPLPLARRHSASPRGAAQTLRNDGIRSGTGNLWGGDGP
mmetsp:Transcript_28936/g.96381  ORF Transcript_28936/g.96381 Transcript_28936/m.96381 type:complete len:236 (-) Transcript_28936:28-735(-)